MPRPISAVDREVSRAAGSGGLHRSLQQRLARSRWRPDSKRLSWPPFRRRAMALKSAWDRSRGPLSSGTAGGGGHSSSPRPLAHKPPTWWSGSDSKVRTRWKFRIPPTTACNRPSRPRTPRRIRLL